MEIAVDGWRAGTAERELARSLPLDQLPRLTDEQRSVAKKLGIPEEEYARSVAAGERNRDALLLKTERLARLLQQRIEASGIDARVNRVTLRTIQDRGSGEAEQQLAHILDRALVGTWQ